LPDRPGNGVIGGGSNIYPGTAENASVGRPQRRRPGPVEVS